MKGVPLLEISNVVQNIAPQAQINPNFSIFKARDAPERLRKNDPFRNDFYVLIFIVTGEIGLTIDFKNYRLTSENVIFISPKQVVATTEDRLEAGFGILFKKDFLLQHSSLLQNLPLFHRFHSQPYLRLPHESQDLLFIYLNQMLLEYSTNGTYKFDIIKANLLLTLLHLSRLYADSQSEQESKNSHLILQFESLIDQHYESIKSVKEYAEMLFMTPQHLNRICKKHTGKSASELINEKVMIEVKRNLIFTRKSIEEIAYSLNFYDNSYFTKYFKKAMGITPKQFRNEHRQDLI